MRSGAEVSLLLASSCPILSLLPPISLALAPNLCHLRLPPVSSRSPSSEFCHYFSLTLINKPVSSSALLNTQKSLSARTQPTPFCLTIRPPTRGPHPNPQIPFKKKRLRRTTVRRAQVKHNCIIIGLQLCKKKIANADF